MTAPSQRYTAAVVGGGMGGRLSLRALAASPHYDLKAVCDLRPEVLATLAKDFPGIRTFTDHGQMFRECPTDIVCVSTFPPSHEAVTMDALKLPLKGILVEKPLGHTATSGRRILEAIKARNLPMAVPHGLLVKHTPLEIIKHVQGGEIGDLKLVEIQCRGWDIINAGIHWLSFFVALTGGDPPMDVLGVCDASTRTFRDGMQVETTAVTSVQTRSGVRCILHTGDTLRVNGEEGRPFLFRLVGTLGMIEFWGWANDYRLLNAAYPTGQRFEPVDDERPPHQRHLDNLAAMIAGGTTDYTVPDCSLVALELCEGAYLSSRLRRVITLPLQDEAKMPPADDWNPGEPYTGTGGGRDGRQFG